MTVLSREENSERAAAVLLNMLMTDVISMGFEEKKAKIYKGECGFF